MFQLVHYLGVNYQCYNYPMPPSLQQTKLYSEACEQLFSQLTTLLDNLDCEYDGNDNLLEITLANEDQVVINRQAALAEIWLAHRSGAHHYQLSENNQWINNRDGSELFAHLRQLIEQAEQAQLS